MRVALIFLCLCLLGVYFWRSSDGPPETEKGSRGTLSLGWESYYPYQVVDHGENTGMDTEVLREALGRAGYRFKLVEQDWATSLAAIEDGSLQGLSLAIFEPAREKYAWFTRPYLSLRFSAFYRLDRYSSVPHNIAALSELILRDLPRVGRARSYAYNQELKVVLDNPELQPHIVLERTEAEGLSDLASNQIDLVFADELSGLSRVMERGWNRTIGCTVIDLPSLPLHLMLSKKAVSEETFQRIDHALADMQASGATAQIVRDYYYPTLLNLLTRGFGFNQIAILATAAASVSGLFMARKSGYNVLGAFVLAAAPAAGGGLIRDLVAGRHPLAVVADPSILSTVIVMTLLACLVFHFFPDFCLDTDHNLLVIILDSLGLGAFTVIGVMVAMQTHCEPLWLWGPLLAAVTNGGGSLLRDLLRGQQPGAVLPGSLYLEISVGWGFALALFLMAYSSYPVPRVLHLEIAVVATVLGTILTRYLALRRHWVSPKF